jgi:hypothetical protein
MVERILMARPHAALTGMRLQSAGRLFRIADIFSGADPSHWGFLSLKQGGAKALREIMPGAWRGAGSGVAGLKKKHTPRVFK